MRRIHALAGVITVPDGDAYAECVCGVKNWADSEAEAFDLHNDHKLSAMASGD